MNEVWEKQQTHEDARKMRRTKNCCLKIWRKNAASVTLEVMIWLEEWIDREKFLIWRRKCSVCARQRMRPKFTNFCARAGEHQRVRQNVTTDPGQDGSGQGVEKLED